MRRKSVPLGAINDAKLLKQWREDNEVFQDPVFEVGCVRRWGKDVFEAAKKQVPFIPRKR